MSSAAHFRRICKQRARQVRQQAQGVLRAGAAVHRQLDESCQGAAKCRARLRDGKAVAADVLQHLVLHLPMHHTGLRRECGLITKRCGEVTSGSVRGQLTYLYGIGR